MPLDVILILRSAVARAQANQVVLVPHFLDSLESTVGMARIITEGGPNLDLEAVRVSLNMQDLWSYWTCEVAAGKAGPSGCVQMKDGEEMSLCSNVRGQPASDLTRTSVYLSLICMIRLISVPHGPLLLKRSVQMPSFHESSP